ncbi:MAG: hypothetical protein ACRC10_10065 [Thermoguttaceae bacterium]
MDRRNWITRVGAIAATLFATGTVGASAQQLIPVHRRGRRGLKKHPNTFYYKNGEFNPDAARAAFKELFDYHNYSLGDYILKSPDFWVNDFQLGDYANVGMGGIFFVNDKEHNYFGHEIYLLPGQMIPEHYHLAAEDMPAKHECWQVRHGQIWTFAQGGSEADVPSGVQLPKSQEGGNITCFKAKKLVVGDQDYLNKLDEPHFMLAGPEGAIVTEYASYHSGEGLRFTNPKGKA